MVNAIVDTLKTAFPRSEPQSPTEDNEAEVDGGKISTDKKNKYDSRDPDQLLSTYMPKTQTHTENQQTLPVGVGGVRQVARLAHASPPRS